MLRILTVLLSLPLLFLLISSYPAPVEESQSVPDIQESTLPRNSRGTASGDNLMQYRGYPASYVLEQLSGMPVTYNLDDDPRIDFYYVYPELTTEEAKKVAVQKLVEFVGGQAREIPVATAGYLLQPTDAFGQVSEKDLGLEGTIKSVHNSEVGATELSLESLAELLNTHRQEKFFVDDTACCTNVRFDSDDAVIELRKQLLATAGVRLKSTERKVPMLQVTK
ncbi:hypothetical protein [Lewinella sp. IMCC34191]|uniref:hypothetical protein n=1 Tax=Lewinella sp. IMCC34191 TaxID=2259172 RepID=UPI0013005909|nr:hypothetical protein [Lewinella sp. IMCC34191]